MNTSMTQIEPPDETPVSIAEVRAHARIDHTAEDGLIEVYLDAAIRRAEGYLRRQLITATWLAALDRFPAAGLPILLPRPPLQSVESIKYIDAAGDEQTLDPSEYFVDTTTTPGSVRPYYGRVWPTATLERRDDAVQVTIVAGYGDDPENVPADYRLALLYLAAHYYARREPDAAGATDDLPPTVKALLRNRAAEFAGAPGGPPW